MYIHLYRKQPQGTVIAGRLVINGRWFCNTMERVGYQIPAICYPIRVTHSPKFKRLLPIVQNVPQRSGIRIHRGSKPEHSSGCVLVVGDNKNDNTDNLRGNQLPAAPKENIPCRSRGILISPDGSNDRSAYDCRGNNRSNECEIRILSKLSSNKNIVDIVENKNIVVSSSLEGVDSSEMLSKLSSKHIPVGCRSAADVEQELTSLILKAQQDHEEIILEVIDFRPGTEYGYNTPCPPELQKP